MSVTSEKRRNNQKPEPTVIASGLHNLKDAIEAAKKVRESKRGNTK